MSEPQVSETTAAQTKSHVTYTAPEMSSDAPSITLLEARSLLGSAGTTGLRTWEASLHLSTFLVSAQGRRYIDGKAILELGAGTGLVSLLCAKHLRAKYVLATDGSGDVVDDLKSNIVLEGLGQSTAIDSSILKWGHALIDGVLGGPDGSRTYDLVLGADVVSYLYC